MNQSEIYEKAAEIIGRDGWTQNMLVERRCPIENLDEALKSAARGVCAIGACMRAEYELTGMMEVDDPYDAYGFPVATEARPGGQPVWAFNDETTTTAEDVVLVLKRHAEHLRRVESR